MSSKILILVLTVGFCATAPAAALAAHSHLGAEQASQTTWHLVVTPTRQRVVGKTYLEADKVARHGTPFGLDILTCPGAARAGVKVAHCTLDLGTRGGTVRAAMALDNSTGAVKGRVTGGSGRFAGATGTITGQGKQNGARLTVALD